MEYETETTCFDYMDECRIRGRKEDIMKQYFLEHEVSEEMINNANNFLNSIKSEVK